MRPAARKTASDVEVLRRDGSVLVKCLSDEQAGERRAAIRKQCRTAEMRGRTGIANADGRIAWVFHVDH
jgi:hypothetical protein